MSQHDETLPPAMANTRVADSPRFARFHRGVWLGGALATAVGIAVQPLYSFDLLAVDGDPIWDVPTLAVLLVAQAYTAAFLVGFPVAALVGRAPFRRMVLVATASLTAAAIATGLWWIVSRGVVTNAWEIVGMFGLCLLFFGAFFEIAVRRA